MKSRKEAVELIHKVLDETITPYGVMELGELIDFIYESEPKNDEEKIKPINMHRATQSLSVSEANNILNKSLINMVNNITKSPNGIDL